MTTSITKIGCIFSAMLALTIMAFRPSEVKTTAATYATNQVTVTPRPPLDCVTPTSNVEKIVCLANSFKALLTTTQIASLEISLTTTSQAKWSNLPGGVSNRNGLEYSTLTATQLAAAIAVVQAAAGTAATDGYAEYNQTRLADTYLGVNGGGANQYSEGRYIIAFLGTPSLTGKWMLQFGGHHYAQNITFNGGKVIGTTPSHQGLEPLSFTTGGTTYQPLQTEHASMLAMLSSLSTAQLATAKLSGSFSDVVLGPGKDGQFPATKLGIKCSTLTTAQKALVLAAIKPWTQDADDASGTALQNVYANEIDETYISYGNNATLATNGDYVRIDGPSVWVELVCQSGVVLSGIHYHTIYRDHTRDYGASGALVGVKEVFGSVADSQFKVSAFYPNPLTWATMVPLTLAFPSKVQVSLFDIYGREVSVVANEQMAAGANNVVINRNQNGNTLTAGSYICKISVENANGKFAQSKLIIVQ